MKKTKKILSLVLSLLMIFSSVGILAEETTTATSFTDVAAGTKTADAITKLVVHGIMNGYPDGSFKPDGSITRAEVAAVIVRFKKLANDLPADAVTGFSDLDNDDSAAWARPYVKAAVDAGIINGFEDGTYRASEPVTYEQVIKMIICAIGYDIVAKSEESRLVALGQQVTWSSGYIAAANKYYITSNALTANVTMPASRGTVAILTSNALDAPAINVVTDKDGNQSYEMGGSSVGEEGRDSLMEIDGYVSGTYYTSLTEQDPGLKIAEITIVSDGREIKYELSNEIRKSIDLEDIIGKRIKAFYSELDRQITMIKESPVNTVVVKEQEIRSLSGSTLKYKNQAVNLDGYTFIYNGKYLPQAEALNLLTTQFKNGQIEIIDDMVKVVKVTDYFVGVVKSYSSTTKQIALRYGDNNYSYEYRPLDFDKAYVDGKDTDPESVTFSNYNVINVMESPAGSVGNKIKKIYVTKKSVSGTITMSNDDARTVEINNTEYFLTNAYNDFTSTPSEHKAPFTVGSSYTCYLDHTGQIAAVNYSIGSGDGYSYGFFLLAKETTKDGYSYEADILTSNGKITKYYLRNKVDLDGVPVDDSSIASTSYISNYVPVRYKTRTNSGVSELTALDTAGVGERTEDNYLKLDYAATDGEFSVTAKGSTLKRGGDTFKVDNKTTILFVPDNRNSRASYAKLDRDKVFKTTGQSFRVDVLDMDNSFANLVIIYAANDPTLMFDDNSGFFLITGKTNLSGGGIDFTGYNNFSSSPTTIRALENDNYRQISGAASTPNLAEKGDIIRYIANGNGEIISLMVWYDASAPVQEGSAANITQAKDTFERYQTTEGGGTVKLFSYGTVLSKGRDDENIVLGYFIDSDTAADKFGEVDGQIQLIKLSGTRIYGETDDGISVLDKDSVKVTEGTTIGSKVVVIWTDTSNPTAKMIYILD